MTDKTKAPFDHSTFQATFKFDMNFTNLLIQGLGKLPGEVSAEPMIGLKGEFERQLNEARMAYEASMTNKTPAAPGPNAPVATPRKRK